MHYLNIFSNTFKIDFNYPFKYICEHISFQLNSLMFEKCIA